MTSDVIADTVLAFLVVIFICSPIFYILVREVYALCKSKRKGPITLTPVIPFPQDNLQVFKGTQQLKNVVWEANIQVDDGKTNEEKDYIDACSRKKYILFEKINKFMDWTFMLHKRLPDEYEEVRSETSEKLYRMKPKISVPNNARTISIKMNGFEHGEKCHDFVPIGGAAPGSHYTYQMFGDNRIQVTRYVVDGKSEIAGFCIYIENPQLSHQEYRWDLLYHLAQSVRTDSKLEVTEGRRNEKNQLKTEGNSQEKTTLLIQNSDENQPKIEVNPEENAELISQESNDREWTVKFCSKLRRNVMSSIDSSKLVVHQEWIHGNNQMRIEKCEECTKEGLEKEEQPPTYSSIFIV